MAKRQRRPFEFLRLRRSWAAFRCLDSRRLVYPISHGSRRRTSRRSRPTRASAACWFGHPVSEDQSLISGGSESGVAGSRSRRCSPMAPVMVPRTRTPRRACAPANCDCSFFLAAKRCCGYFIRVNGIEWRGRLYTQAGLVPPVPKPPTVEGRVGCGSPLPSARPENPGPLGPLHPMRTVSNTEPRS